MAEERVLVDNKAVPVSETKTVISFNKETPMWARMMFRITFLITTAAVGYIAASSIIPQGTKYEITIVLKLFVDPIVYGVSKMFGIDLKKENE